MAMGGGTAEARVTSAESPQQQQSQPSPQASAHPLDLGSKVRCRRTDGSESSCELIEREYHGGEWRYYVHHEGTDRRLDDWIGEEQVILDDGCGVTSGPQAGRRGSNDSLNGRRATRNMKRKIDEINHHQNMSSYDAELEKEHEESTKVKNIKVIEMGAFEIDTWYFAPYPDPFAQQTRLYICPFSLKYFKCRTAYTRHLGSVTRRGPPGLKIYSAPAPTQSEAVRKSGLQQPARLTLYEVDGSQAKVYCQCLCLLAKLFLDHKTLYYDVDPFLFYIMCEEDERGCARSWPAVGLCPARQGLRACHPAGLPPRRTHPPARSPTPCQGLDPRRLLLQGEDVGRGEQHRLHPRHAAAPAQGLRQAAHRPGIQHHDPRGQARLPGETSL